MHDPRLAELPFPFPVVEYRDGAVVLIDQTKLPGELAWREDIETFGEMLQRINLVPVSISYELDPCDQDKARELTLLARDGEYRKAPDEDLNSIVHGLLGFKGRMHLHFSAPVKETVADADELAAIVDKAIVAGLKVFPTQAAAAMKEMDPEAMWRSAVRRRMVLRYWWSCWL